MSSSFVASQVEAPVRAVMGMLSEASPVSKFMQVSVRGGVRRHAILFYWFQPRLIMNETQSGLSSGSGVIHSVLFGEVRQ